MFNLNLSVSRMLIRLLIFFTVNVTLSSCKKDNAVASGTISGRVVDQLGSALSNVKITLDGQSHQSATTSATGAFIIENVIVGDYNVLASKDKYISANKAVTVTEDGMSTADFKLQIGEPTLKLSTDAFLYSSRSSGNAVEVYSNSAWTVESSADWLKPEITAGQGNGTVTFYAEENATEEARTATITISTGTLKKNVNVTQDVKLKLLYVSLSNPISDLVVLHFNKPVDEIKIEALNQYCLSTLDYNAHPQATEVSFSYSCAELGGSYPFRLTLKDKIATYTEDVKVDFFSKRLTFSREGYISYPNCYVFEDTKTLWICSIDERVIQEVDIETFQIVRTYTLPIKVGRLCFNPYNKLIYITGESPDFYMLDPVAHKIVGKKTMTPIPGDFEAYPEIYPTMMGFTKSGIGIMTCQGSGPYAGTWKMIDSRKDNLVYYYKDRSAMENIGDIAVSSDQTRLIVKRNFNNDLYSFDPLKDDIKVILPPVAGGIGDVKPNKKNGNMMFVQVYHQYLHNPETNYLSQISYLGHAYKGDFSYRPNEDGIVYAFDADDYLQVLDYRSATTILQFPILNGMNSGETISTTDGKYLIASSGTTIYRFDTELLSRKTGSKASNKTSSIKKLNAFRK
jgi:hypothetical protein